MAAVDFNHHIQVTHVCPSINSIVVANLILNFPCIVILVEVIAEEDTHYSQTVSSILENQSNRWSKLTASAASAFSKWFPSPTSSSSAHRHNLLLDGASQWVLKYILFTLPLLHTKPRASAAATPADELSGNHVLAERRRREKLNERFVILRSMVPFITKMDKASILADTIEYLKQLKKRIQDLESRVRQLEAEKGRGGGREKRKMRAAPPQEEVEVSIIECDALVEISCLQKEGLVLEVMHVLRGVGLQVTTVQSSINNNNGTFNAELRAKVSSIFNSIYIIRSFSTTT